MDYIGKAKELVSKMTIAERMSQLRYDSPAIERLGIPAYNWWNEALHGVARAGRATVFPQAIAMAAAFDSSLLHDVAVAISEEGRAKYNQYRRFGDTGIYQGVTFWSPNINIFRDPRWGRGHETYGEDPFLTGVLGSAFVSGIQGEDGEHRRADATLKHYAVHSGPEALRHGFDAVVSKRDLYETYLSAFEYCIKHSHPAAVMGAYNSVYGEACCASPYLLGDILRGEFGFDGYVVSDCGAICDINSFHHFTETAAESAALAVKSGCDLNCGSAYQHLMTAYTAGLVGDEEITVACERLYAARLRLDIGGESPFDSISGDVIECAEHTSLNRRMAREGVVLLKNDGILPLKGQKSLAVIGPNADEYEILIGNYNGTPSFYSTPLAGIQRAACKRGIRTVYAEGCHVFKTVPDDSNDGLTREALIAAGLCDAVIFIGGLNPRMEGEEGDAYNGAWSGDRNTIELPDSQKALYKKLIARGKPVIFVNVSGSCVNLSDQDAECAAVLQCFYPGAEGGDALADILFGEYSPSGRLPVTFYASDSDLPPFEDYSMANRTYRYFAGKPLYPFGFGLSYADIECESLSADISESGLDIALRLVNRSDIPSDHSALVFLLPDENPDGVPLRRLIAFGRCSLGANGVAELYLHAEQEQLMYTGEDGKRFIRRGGYTLEAGGKSVHITL